MNIFENLMSPESLYVFLWLLGAFLIGLILGWFIWGKAVRQLNEEVTQLRNKLRLSQTDVDTLKAESILLDKQINGLNKQTVDLNKKIGDLNKEVKTKHTRLHNIEVEKGNLHTQNIKLKNSLKAIESEKLAFGTQIEDLSTSYNGTKSEAEALALKVAGLEAELNAAANTHTTLENKLKALENRTPVIPINLGKSSDDDTNTTVHVDGNLKAAQTRIAVLEGMLAGYKEQLSDVENDLAASNASKAELHAATIIAEAEEETESSSETEFELGAVETEIETEAEPSLETANELDTESAPEETNVTTAKAAVAAALAGSIGLASRDSRDNLTKISGIGKFLAKKLNALGIYKFAQIANFDEAMIHNVTAAIEFFPGRIERDEWVRQAKELNGDTPKVEVVEVVVDADVTETEIIKTTEVEDTVELIKTVDVPEIAVVEVEADIAETEIVKTTEVEDTIELVKTVDVPEVEVAEIENVIEAVDVIDVPKVEVLETEADVTEITETKIVKTLETKETVDITKVVKTIDVADVVVETTEEIEKPKPMPNRLEAIEAADKARAEARAKAKVEAANKVKVEAETKVEVETEEAKVEVEEAEVETVKVEAEVEEKIEEVVVEGAPAISKVDSEAAKEIVKSKIGATIPVATADEKDDLKEISGVGPFIEEKLNDLGLFTYEQISLFDYELVDHVTDAIEFFPGRIKRDNWVKQAKDLLKQKKANIASTTLGSLIGNRITAATADEKDNLKKISGVGPFIEEKMNNLGIYTFKQISEFDEEIIELITDAIQFFPGRIVRDEWVRQAGELHKGKA